MTSAGRGEISAMQSKRPDAAALTREAIRFAEESRQDHQLVHLYASMVRRAESEEQARVHLEEAEAALARLIHPAQAGPACSHILGCRCS